MYSLFHCTLPKPMNTIIFSFSTFASLQLSSLQICSLKVPTFSKSVVFLLQFCKFPLSQTLRLKVSTFGKSGEQCPPPSAAGQCPQAVTQTQLENWDFGEAIIFRFSQKLRWQILWTVKCCVRPFSCWPLSTSCHSDTTWELSRNIFKSHKLCTIIFKDFGEAVIFRLSQKLRNIVQRKMLCLWTEWMLKTGKVG